MRNVLLLLLAVVLVAGCAVPTKKNWSATGGSRADATVRLSYEFGGFEQPVVDEQEALRLAEERCRSWGYSGAEAFGGITKTCNQYGGYGSSGCSSWLVTKEFQCLGKGDAKR